MPILYAARPAAGSTTDDTQIVPGHNNQVAIDLICTHIRQQLEGRSNRFRPRMAIPHLYLQSADGSTTPEPRVEDLNLTVLPPTNQLKVDWVAPLLDECG